MKSFKKNLILVPIIAIILLIGVYLLSRPSKTNDAAPTAPDFSFSLLNGKRINLSDYQGKPVVINFWASWCPPCRAEAPTLTKIANRYKGQVQFLGVVYQDSEANARAFIKEFGIPYPNGIDVDGKITAAYKVTGVPETFFVDKDGRLQGHWIGAIDEPTLTGYIDKLL